jgi:hypothetical protein
MAAPSEPVGSPVQGIRLAVLQHELTDAFEDAAAEAELCASTGVDACCPPLPEMQRTAESLWAERQKVALIADADAFDEARMRSQMEAMGAHRSAEALRLLGAPSGLRTGMDARAALDSPLECRRILTKRDPLKDEVIVGFPGTEYEFVSIDKTIVEEGEPYEGSDFIVDLYANREQQLRLQILGDSEQEGGVEDARQTEVSGQAGCSVAVDAPSRSRCVGAPADPPGGGGGIVLDPSSMEDRGYETDEDTGELVFDDPTLQSLCESAKALYNQFRKEFNFAPPIHMFRHFRDLDPRIETYLSQELELPYYILPRGDVALARSRTLTKIRYPKVLDGDMDDLIETDVRSYLKLGRVLSALFEEEDRGDEYSNPRYMAILVDAVWKAMDRLRSKIDATLAANPGLKSRLSQNDWWATNMESPTESRRREVEAVLKKAERFENAYRMTASAPSMSEFDALLPAESSNAYYAAMREIYDKAREVALPEKRSELYVQYRRLFVRKRMLQRELNHLVELAESELPLVLDAIKASRIQVRSLELQVQQARQSAEDAVRASTSPPDLAATRRVVRAQNKSVHLDRLLQLEILTVQDLEERKRRIEGIKAKTLASGARGSSADPPSGPPDFNFKPFPATDSVTGDLLSKARRKRAQKRRRDDAADPCEDAKNALRELVDNILQAHAWNQANEEAFGAAVLGFKDRTKAELKGDLAELRAAVENTDDVSALIGREIARVGEQGRQFAEDSNKSADSVPASAAWQFFQARSNQMYNEGAPEWCLPRRSILQGGYKKCLKTRANDLAEQERSYRALASQGGDLKAGFLRLKTQFLKQEERQKTTFQNFGGPLEKHHPEWMATLVGRVTRQKEKIQDALRVQSQGKVSDTGKVSIHSFLTRVANQCKDGAKDFMREQVNRLQGVLTAAWRNAIETTIGVSDVLQNTPAPNNILFQGIEERRLLSVAADQAIEVDAIMLRDSSVDDDIVGITTCFYEIEALRGLEGAGRAAYFHRLALEICSGYMATEGSASSSSGAQNLLQVDLEAMKAEFREKSKFAGETGAVRIGVEVEALKTLAKRWNKMPLHLRGCEQAPWRFEQYPENFPRESLVGEPFFDNMFAEMRVLTPSDFQDGDSDGTPVAWAWWGGSLVPVGPDMRLPRRFPNADGTYSFSFAATEEETLGRYMYCSGTASLDGGNPDLWRAIDPDCEMRARARMADDSERWPVADAHVRGMDPVDNPEWLSPALKQSRQMAHVERTALRERETVLKFALVSAESEKQRVLKEVVDRNVTRSVSMSVELAFAGEDHSRILDLDMRPAADARGLDITLLKAQVSASEIKKELRKARERIREVCCACAHPSARADLVTGATPCRWARTSTRGPLLLAMPCLPSKARGSLFPRRRHGPCAPREDP